MKDLLIVGGDRRAMWLSHIASQKGYRVQSCGFDDCETDIPIHSISIDDARDADVIVLPFPYQKEGNIQTPLGTPIPLEKLKPRLYSCSLVVAGRVDEALFELSARYGFKVTDVYGDDTYTMENAIPSSEGAIHAAMSQSSVILHGNECLVVGYGRIGKVLAKQLSGLGAHVSVFARNPCDRALARAMGFSVVSPDDWHSALGQYRFIFNTVPYLLLDRHALGLVRQDVLIIDVSSAPYGVDFGAAKELSIKASLEPALPGRYSPETAGQILFGAIEPYLI